LVPLLRHAPELLFVQGDTSSALGAALAAFTAGVPVAHVEAGLRTWDPALPWPEEEYRTAIDAQADLLFAPTETAAANLRVEGVPGSIHVTGNTGIDALLELETRLPPRARREATVGRVLVTCHRRENWGDGLNSIAEALVQLASPDVDIEMIMPPNPHVRRRITKLLGSRAGVRLIAPCSHPELVARMRDADLVMSDSGGMQEEAPALGVPMLVLREKTERPEGIATGNALLVGTSTRAIVEAARRILADPVERAQMAKPALPYGDGRASQRIAEIVERWLCMSRSEPKNLRLRNSL